MSAFITRRLFAAAVAVAMTAGLFVLPAYAGEAPHFETKIAVVSTAGLDLTTQQGAAMLNGRVHQAVNDLCGAPDLEDGAQLAAVRRCRAGAVAATMPQIQAAIELAARRAPSVVQVSSIAQ